MVLGMAVFIRRAGSPVPRNAFSEWFWIEDGMIRKYLDRDVLPRRGTPCSELAALRRQLSVARVQPYAARCIVRTISSLSSAPLPEQRRML